MNLKSLLAKKGSVIILDTETIPGLSGLYNDQQAFENICKIKQRSADMPISILVSSTTMAQKVGKFTRQQLEAAKALWPWCTTIVPKNPNFPHLTEGTIGMRLTSINSLAAEIENLGGPLFSTSVNKHGKPFALNFEEAKNIFDLPAYKPTDLAHTTNQPSTLVNFTTSPISILRSESFPKVTEILEKNGLEYKIIN